MASKVRKRVNAAMRERRRQRREERNRPPNERLVRLRKMLFGDGPVPEMRPYVTGEAARAADAGGAG
jgi:hypothetical protein